MTPDQKKNNRRLGIILGTVVLAFFIGFMARSMLLGMG